MRLRSLLSLGLAFSILAGPLAADPPRSSGGWTTSRTPSYSTSPRTPSYSTTSPRTPSQGGWTTRRTQDDDFRRSPAARTDDSTRSQSGWTTNRQPPAATTTDDSTRSQGGWTTNRQPPAATTTARPDDNTRGQGGWTTNRQPTTTATTDRRVIPPASPVIASEADKAIARGQSKQAYQQFLTEQNKFKTPPVAAPVNRQTAQQSSVWRSYGTTASGARWTSADDYWAARNRALTTMPRTVNNYYTNPPVWVRNGPPSYGGFSSNFLGGVLLGAAGTALYDSWAYSHRTDPGYIAWHRDMERQAQDNDELRQKLTLLDTRVAELEAQKAPVSDKLPNDIDPSLVVAPDTALLATANEGTNWWIWGPVGLILALGTFMVICVVVARNRRPQYG